MLELLRIHNLALIEDLEMEFAPGMNVLTGETGAGKSFIFKALQFLTGDKLAPDLVRPGKERAEVEALFFVDGQETILRRELSGDSGRSRLYVNDRLCSQEVVRAMRPGLLLHASQHGRQKLLQPSFQAGLLDGFLDRPDLLAEKERLVHALSECRERMGSLEKARLSLEEKRDVLEYQQQEIEKVNPQAGEEEELEAQRAAARNQTGIRENAVHALAALHGADNAEGLFTSLALLERSINSLAVVLNEFADAPDALADMRALLQDMESQLRKAAGRITRPEDTDAVEARLYALAQLKRKLKRSLNSILSLHTDITENLRFLDSCNSEQQKLREEESALCDSLADLLAVLNPARQQAAEALAQALEEELSPLGFSEHLRVFFEFIPHRLHTERDDCTELSPRLLWQPNPGHPAQTLDRIASDGELSRFLLAAVTLMSKKNNETPTLIFDEVDAGIGGHTLNRVADSLVKLAGVRQMLLITHWPQLAARAERHFVVEKNVKDEQTFTRCTLLDRAAVKRELTRMAG